MVHTENISSLDHVKVNDRLNVSMMYPNEFSYSETFIRNQIKHLPENVFPLYGAWFPYLQPGRKHVLSRNPISRGYRKIRRSLLGISQHQLMVEGLTRYLIKNRIDVVLAHYAPTGLAVMECCEAANVPLVVHFHGFDAFEHRTLKENEKAYKELFRSAQKVIVVAQHMKDQVQSLGCLPDKIAVNACGVDTEYFSGGAALEPPPRFIAVGRFTQVKGPQFTLKAFQLVLQEISEAKLIMIGDGELLTECEDLAKSLDIVHAVEFPGPLNSEDVLNALRLSRVFVQHGIRSEQVSAEGMGLSCMEASSVGLPVVATNHGGLKESVVDGETGFLVEEGDVTAMAGYMKKLAQDDALCLHMGRKGRERMKELFDLSRRIDTLDNILHEACGK